MDCLCQGVLCTVCVRVSYALFVSGCLMHCLCQGVLCTVCVRVSCYCLRLWKNHSSGVRHRKWPSTYQKQLSRTLHCLHCHRLSSLGTKCKKVIMYLEN